MNLLEKYPKRPSTVLSPEILDELGPQERQYLRRRILHEQRYSNKKRNTNHYDWTRNRKAKRKVVEYYSAGKNYCECCYEDNLAFLTVDHIHKGGTKHTDKVGKGSRFYHWLIRNKFPDGYRILCYNCNCSNKRTGICPHKMETNEEW